MQRDSLSNSLRAAFLLLSVFVFLLDIATKNWAVEALLGAPPVVLAPFLRFVYVENTGAAFGIFAGGGVITRWALTGLSIIITAVLLFYLWRRVELMIEAAACTLIVGGAAGNLHDRLLLGYVVDFIDVHWGEYHWPAFNIADSAITGGVLLLAYSMTVNRKQ